MGGGEESAIRVLGDLLTLDDMAKCPVEGCTTHCYPAGSKCREHGGAPIVEEPYDEWGEDWGEE